MFLPDMTPLVLEPAWRGWRTPLTAYLLQVGMQTRFLPQSTQVARCQYEYTVIDPATTHAPTRSSAAMWRCSSPTAPACAACTPRTSTGCAWCEEYAARDVAAPAPAAMPCGAR